MISRLQSGRSPLGILLLIRSTLRICQAVEKPCEVRRLVCVRKGEQGALVVD